MYYGQGRRICVIKMYEDTEEHYVNIDQFMSSSEVNYVIINIFSYSQHV
jgi:hypothetical protein